MLMDDDDDGLVIVARSNHTYNLKKQKVKLYGLKFCQICINERLLVFILN